MNIKQAFRTAAYWLGDHVLSTGAVMDQWGNNPYLKPVANFLRQPMVNVGITTAFTAAALETCMLGTPFAGNSMANLLSVAGLSVGLYAADKNNRTILADDKEYYVVREPARQSASPQIIAENNRTAVFYKHQLALQWMLAGAVGYVTANGTGLGSGIGTMSVWGAIALARSASHIYRAKQIENRRWSVHKRLPPQQEQENTLAPIRTHAITAKALTAHGC